ncbi:MAG: energy transducer TonB [Bacteroidia bacterium]|nr:energy transducer TonB [Bacteroidia bacterium]
MVKFIFIIFIFNNLWKILFSQVDDNTDYIGFDIPDVKPVFRGDLSEFIKIHTNYPDSALSDSIIGNVLVSFIIDINGNTLNHKIVKGLGKYFDNEALRVAKLIKYEKPAMLRGRKIQLPEYVIIKFKPPKQ